MARWPAVAASADSASGRRERCVKTITCDSISMMDLTPPKEASASVEIANS